MRRVAIGGASAVLLASLAWPAIAPGELDSLPWSNYPMFAHERDRVTGFYVAIRVDPDGAEHRLDLRAVGGTDQPVQAAMTVAQAVRTGQADQLCSEVAERVEQPGAVEILSVRYDAPGWFDGRREPISRTVHARCPTGGDR